MKIHLSSPQRINEAVSLLAQTKPDGSHNFELKKIAKKRTPKQNRTLWKWFEYIAVEFMNVGQSIQMGNLEIEPKWDKDLVCDLMMRPILLAVTGKKTTQTTVDNLSECIDYMRDGLEKAGYDIAVPSREQLMKGEQ